MNYERMYDGSSAIQQRNELILFNNYCDSNQDNGNDGHDTVSQRNGLAHTFPYVQTVNFKFQ